MYSMGLLHRKVIRLRFTRVPFMRLVIPQLLDFTKKQLRFILQLLYDALTL
jgi:hypothetical protein